MDQRNTGTSFAPITAADGWPSYAADQLALMDHLGSERFAVVGMCIGGAFIMELIAEAPERVNAAVAMQPIGLAGNRAEFRAIFDEWRKGIADEHPEASDADWEGVWSNLFGGDNVLWSVPDAAPAHDRDAGPRPSGRRRVPPEGGVAAARRGRPDGDVDRAVEGSGGPAGGAGRRGPLPRRPHVLT